MYRCRRPPPINSLIGFFASMSFSHYLCTSMIRLSYQCASDLIVWRRANDKKKTIKLSDTYCVLRCVCDWRTMTIGHNTLRIRLTCEHDTDRHIQNKKFNWIIISLVLLFSRWWDEKLVSVHMAISIFLFVQSQSQFLPDAEKRFNFIIHSKNGIQSIFDVRPLIPATVWPFEDTKKKRMP